MLLMKKEKEENDCRKYFMISLHERMFPEPGLNQPSPDHLTDAQPTSHQGQPVCVVDNNSWKFSEVKNQLVKTWP